MSSKQFWLVGTDISGRCKFGAEQTKFDFDLSSVFAPFVDVQFKDYPFYIFVKNEQSYAICLYQHAYESEVIKRLGSFVGVAIEFPLTERLNNEQLFKVLTSKSQEVSQELMSSNEVRIFQKRLQEHFSWMFTPEKIAELFSSLIPDNHTRILTSKNHDSEIFVSCSNLDGIHFLFSNFLEQTKYSHMYVVNDSVIERLSSYDKKLFTFESEYSIYELCRKERNKELVSLYERESNLIQKIDSLENKNEKLSNSKSELDEQIVNYMNYSNQLQDSLNHLETENNGLKSEISDLQQSIEKLSNSNSELDEQIVNHMNYSNQLQDSLNHLKTENNGLKSEISDLQQSIEKIINKISSYQKEIPHLDVK